MKNNNNKNRYLIWFIHTKTKYLTSNRINKFQHFLWEASLCPKPINAWRRRYGKPCWTRWGYLCWWEKRESNKVSRRRSTRLSCAKRKLCCCNLPWFFCVWIIHPMLFAHSFFHKTFFGSLYELNIIVNCKRNTLENIGYQ